MILVISAEIILQYDKERQLWRALSKSGERVTEALADTPEKATGEAVTKRLAPELEELKA